MQAIRFPVSDKGEEGGGERKRGIFYQKGLEIELGALWQLEDLEILTGQGA